MNTAGPTHVLWFFIQYADAIYLHTRLFCAYRSNVLIAIININMFTYTVDLL